MTHRLPLFALASALLSLASSPAGAKPGAGPPSSTKPGTALPHRGSKLLIGKISLEVSPDMGDLGHDWRKALGFSDHTARFDFRWQYGGASLGSAIYRVYDSSDHELVQGPISKGTGKTGRFSLNLKDLPPRDVYRVRVQATGKAGPVGEPSNAVTLTLAESKPIPFGFADLSVEGVRKDYGLPGLSVAVSCHPGDAKEWVAGVRRQGNTVKVQRGDRWHIGSNTKALTTTMIGKLVEEGLIDWDTSIWELTHGPRNLFPELKGIAAPLGNNSLDPRFKDVTIEHLASHRSGMRMRSSEDSPTRQFPNYAKDPTQFRWQTVRSLLTRPHTGIIGEWRYGHGNYMLLGVIIERLRSKPYEQVIEEEILAPAGMTTAAFGMPTDVVLPPPGPSLPFGPQGSESDNPWVQQTFQAFTVNTTAQPNGHVLAGGKPTVNNLALPPVWNPAGGLYLSGPDMLRFLRLHIDGKVGGLSLKPQTLNKLHSIYTGPDRAKGPADAKPEDQGDPNYGWGLGQWTDGKYGRVLSHDGTYGRFYSSMRVYLDRGFAVTVSTNVAGGNKAKGVAVARNWAVGQAKIHCKIPKTVSLPRGTKGNKSPRVRGVRVRPSKSARSVERSDYDLQTPPISTTVTRPRPLPASKAGSRNSARRRRRRGG